MQLNSYLTFNGQCEAAFKFYEQALGGKIEAMIAHAGTPAGQHVPPEFRDKIIHARLNVGNGILMGCDAPADGYETPKGFPCRSPSRTRWMRNAYSRHWQSAGRYGCRSRKPSGPPFLVCWLIDSAYRGWLAASKLRRTA